MKLILHSKIFCTVHNATDVLLMSHSSLRKRLKAKRSPRTIRLVGKNSTKFLLTKHLQLVKDDKYDSTFEVHRYLQSTLGQINSSTLDRMIQGKILKDGKTSILVRVLVRVASSELSKQHVVNLWPRVLLQLGFDRARLGKQPLEFWRKRHTQVIKMAIFECRLVELSGFLSLPI